MKLTWNQRRALENLAGCTGSVSSRMLADPSHGVFPYLCGASARTAVMALVRKCLAEVTSTNSPMLFRITPAGRQALATSKGGTNEISE